MPEKRRVFVSSEHPPSLNTEEKKDNSTHVKNDILTEKRRVFVSSEHPPTQS